MGGINAAADTFTVQEDSTAPIFDVLANDTTDLSGATLTITAVGATNHGGTVSLAQNGTRVSYTFSPRMFLSGLLQYNSTNNTFSTNLRLRWEYQPGSEFFVVYTEDRNTNVLGRVSELANRGLVVKINRLFRF